MIVAPPSDPNIALEAALIGFLGVLVGGGISGSVQFFLSRAQFRREKAWSLYEARRTRLEHVYETVEQIRESYRSSPFFGLVSA